MAQTNTKRDRIQRATTARANRANALTIVPSSPIKSGKKAQTKRRRAMKQIATPREPQAPRELEHRTLFTPPAALYFDRGDIAARRRTARTIEQFIDSFANPNDPDPRRRRREALQRALESSPHAPSEAWVKKLLYSLNSDTLNVEDQDNPGPIIAGWMNCRVQKRIVPMTEAETQAWAVKQEQRAKARTKRRR